MISLQYNKPITNIIAIIGDGFFEIGLNNMDFCADYTPYELSLEAVTTINFYKNKCEIFKPK